jgi:hypothetical protein
MNDDGVACLPLVVSLKPVRHYLHSPFVSPHISFSKLKTTRTRMATFTTLD